MQEYLLLSLLSGVLFLIFKTLHNNYYKFKNKNPSDDTKNNTNNTILLDTGMVFISTTLAGLIFKYLNYYELCDIKSSKNIKAFTDSPNF